MNIWDISETKLSSQFLVIFNAHNQVLLCSSSLIYKYLEFELNDQDDYFLNILRKDKFFSLMRAFLPYQHELFTPTGRCQITKYS